MDEEELKLKIDKLSIQERKIETSFGGTTIIGDLISNGIGSSSINLKKRSSGQSNTIIEIKKVNKKTKKLLNETLIEFASHYINNFVKPTNKEWQITRNFVTSLIEVY